MVGRSIHRPTVDQLEETRSPSSYDQSHLLSSHQPGHTSGNWQGSSRRNRASAIHEKSTNLPVSIIERDQKLIILSQHGITSSCPGRNRRILIGRKERLHVATKSNALHRDRPIPRVGGISNRLIAG